MSQPLIYLALIVGGFMWGATTTWIAMKATLTAVVPKAITEARTTGHDPEEIVEHVDPVKASWPRSVWDTGTPFSRLIALLGLLALLVGGAGTFVVIDNQAKQAECTQDYTVYQANRNDISNEALEQMIKTVTNPKLTQPDRFAAIQQWQHVRDQLGPMPTLEEFCSGQVPTVNRPREIPTPSSTG